MAFFGFKSSKEVEEEKRQAAEEAARQVVQNNLTNLSNLSKGSQVNFAIPYFDVFDPRFMDQGVPVAVHGVIVYSIDDMDLFHQVNKNEAYSDETFKNKLKGQVTKFVKGVVSNAPADAQIPVVQLERKIMQISELVQQYVTPKVEQLFGITVRSLDITNINIDKESRGFRELKALTADLERDRTLQQHNIGMEMNQMQTVEQMRMQMEDQRERLRIQREGLERGQEKMIEDGRYGRVLGGGNMFGGIQQPMMGGMQQPMMGGMQQPMMGGIQQPMMGGMQQPMMGGMQQPMMGGMPPTPPAMPSMRQFHVFLNGQQAGPYDVNTISQMVQQGSVTAQTQVWAQGMAQWAAATSVAELAPLFAAANAQPTPPPMGGGTPPPPTGGSIPSPTL